MNSLVLAFKNIKQQLATSLLGVLLTAFGCGILCVLILTSHQLEDQLSNNTKGVDLVVGAKGSPIQLILSSIYHVDNPTGNISYAEAQKLKEHPMVKLAVPLALGDNYKGHRIVGTDSTFLIMHELEIAEGNLWKTDFEAVIGAEVAQKRGLKIGDEFVGAHGLSDEAHVHESHPYVVKGILKPTGRITDRLILSNVESVWQVHGLHQEDHDHDHEEHDHAEHKHDHEAHSHDHAAHDHSDHQEETTALVKEKPSNSVTERLVKNIMGDDQPVEREITSLLIKYSTPAAIGVLPRTINQSTSMQAASPALESARLFSLLGMGIDSLQLLGYVIMLMAALSVFISLYNALKNRKYDMAILRTLGASRGKLVGMVIAEGILITFVGAIFGIALGHGVMYLISVEAGQSGSLIDALR